MSVEQPLSPELELAVLELYNQDMSMNAVTKAMGLRYPVVRSILLEHNVPIRGKAVMSPKGSRHPSSKLSEDQRNQLLLDLQLGQTSHNELAKHYGISRERVRQIAKEHSCPSGRDIAEYRREQREDARQTRVMERKILARRRYEHRYLVWRDLWADGKSIADIAAIMGTTVGTVGVRIAEIRKKFPDWFPYRLPRLNREDKSQQPG